VVVDRSYQQLIDTLKDFGTALPPTADPDTAQRVINSRRWQISNLFKGSISGRPVFNVEVPVLDAEDQTRYVLITFQAAHLVEVMKKTPLEAPWITGITDNKGVILARSEVSSASSACRERLPRDGRVHTGRWRRPSQAKSAQRSRSLADCWGPEHSPPILDTRRKTRACFRS